MRYYIFAIILLSIACNWTRVKIDPEVPLASFKVINDGCFAPCEIMFENLSQNTTSSMWNFGDGSPEESDSSSIVSHTYTSVGIFPVTLKVSGVNNTNDQSTINVTTVENPTNIFIPEMISLTAGSFSMGRTVDPNAQCTGCSEDELPVHRVTLTAFSIGKYEVTIEEFGRFIEFKKYVTRAEKNGYCLKVTYKNNEGSVTACIDTIWGANWCTDENGNLRSVEEKKIYPVVNISHEDASEYCKWLSDTTGKSFHLPTEAQWEYAARGGKDNPNFVYAGSNNPDEVTWYNSSLQPIGLKKPNDLDIYDMSGNANEYCRDYYNSTFYQFSPENDPVNGTPTADNLFVARGGVYNFPRPDICRIANRGGIENKCYANNGFRIVEEF